MTTGMQSSDAATGVRVNCLYHILVRSGMLETNKQVLIFKFGEDLSYFVILRYKLRDFIKIYDDYVSGPIKGDFQKTFSYYFISAGIKVSWNINGFGCIQHVKAC